MAEWNGRSIRRISPSGIIDTVAGLGRVLPGTACPEIDPFEDPEGRVPGMEYSNAAGEHGLLERLWQADGEQWDFTYDNGRLVSDQSPTITQLLERREGGDTGYTCDADVSSAR